MAYSDNTTIIEHISELEIIELTDDEKLATGDTTVTAAVVSNSEIQDRIDRAIANADAVINAFIQKQVNVPALIDPNAASSPSNSPPLLIMGSSILAVAFLYKRRRGEFTDLPQTVKDEKKGVMDWLKMINKGEIELGVSPSPAKSPLVVADSEGEDRLFTETTLEDF